MYRLRRVSGAREVNSALNGWAESEPKHSPPASLLTGARGRPYSPKFGFWGFSEVHHQS